MLGGNRGEQLIDVFEISAQSGSLSAMPSFWIAAMMLLRRATSAGEIVV